jgi:ribosomal protein S14
MMASVFDNSSVFKPISEATKKLVEEHSGSVRLKKRDPAMYGDHHKCNKCSEPAKYIAKDTHWCRYCLDTEEYPQLAGKTQDERDAIRDEALYGKKAGGHSLGMKSPESSINKIGF